MISHLTYRSCFKSIRYNWYKQEQSSTMEISAKTQITFVGQNDSMANLIHIT